MGRRSRQPAHCRSGTWSLMAAYSLSRLSGAILPFITVAVLDNLGAATVFVGCAAIMAIVGLDVALLGPRSTGQVLEASSDETRGGGRFERTWTPRPRSASRPSSKTAFP